MWGTGSCRVGNSEHGGLGSGVAWLRLLGILLQNEWAEVGKSRGCRGQSSNRKCSDKSKKVSINSTPTLDTQTVPIAAKLPDTSSPLSSPNL